MGDDHQVKSLEHTRTVMAFTWLCRSTRRSGLVRHSQAGIPFVASQLLTGPWLMISHKISIRPQCSCLPAKLNSRMLNRVIISMIQFPHVQRLWLQAILVGCVGITKIHLPHLKSPTVLRIESARGSSDHCSRIPTTLATCTIMNNHSFHFHGRLLSLSLSSTYQRASSIRVVQSYSGYTRLDICIMFRFSICLLHACIHIL